MTGTTLPRRVLFGLVLLRPVLAAAQEAPEFDALLHDSGGAHVIGRLSLDSASRLRMVAAVPERAEWLQRVVAETNSANVMHEDAAPPPGTAPSTDASRIVRRGDPDFPRLLRADLQTYYGIELRPAPAR